MVSYYIKFIKHRCNIHFDFFDDLPFLWPCFSHQFAWESTANCFFRFFTANVPAVQDSRIHIICICTCLFAFCNSISISILYHFPLEKSHFIILSLVCGKCTVWSTCSEKSLRSYQCSHIEKTSTLIQFIAKHRTSACQNWNLVSNHLCLMIIYRVLD